MEGWHLMSSETVEGKLETDSEEGLDSSQVRKRTLTYGENKLKDKSKESIIKKILKQLKDPSIIVLLIATIVSFFIGEYKNSAVIMLIVVVNTVIGIMQERKAEQSLEAIKKMTSPKAQVIRDGGQEIINAESLVPGDIVILEAGDYVPADVRIVESFDLKVNESSLTGESIDVLKSVEEISDSSAPLGDMINMAFMGSTVTYGRGKGIVVETGMNTEIGGIANMISNTKTSNTPLQIKLKELSKILGIISIVVCILIFILGIVQGKSTYTVFLNAFSLAVAAIPEGLPAIVTVVLALGMQKMAKQNAIMRTLPAVETSGAANIICSDKTGTLTENKMTVKKVFLGGKFYTSHSMEDLGELKNKFLLYGSLCNDTVVQKSEDGFETIGDATEVALVDFMLKSNEGHNINAEEVIEQYKRIYEIPFDSDRKLMTTVNEIDGKKIAITKGAPEVLINLCTNVELSSGVREFNDSLKENVLNNANSMYQEALRVLAIGYSEVKETSNDAIEPSSLEKNITFLGLYGIIDPPRKEVQKSIEQCDKAGIRTVMITGDNEITALSIAKELGIAEFKNQCINGSTLEKLSDEELNETIDNYRVFARVSPKHKLKIVSALQSRGNVVIMTGDGVNDAPALKKADIGVSMGMAGTEVAKEASDMILADDNFGTIVSAIRYGRVIYSNICKAVHFLLSGNISEIISIFLASLLGPMIFNMPISLLSAIQILWINLVSDSLLAIALAFEPEEPGVMEKNPRNIKDSILTGGLGIRIAYQGFLIGVITFIAYTIGFYMFYDQGVEIALKNGNTMAFMTLAFIQFFHVFNVRSMENSLATIGVFTNKKLIYAFLINVIVQLITIIIPVLRESVFNLAVLSLRQWIIVLSLSVLPILLVEIEKRIVKFVKGNRTNKAFIKTCAVNKK